MIRARFALSACFALLLAAIFACGALSIGVAFADEAGTDADKEAKKLSPQERAQLVAKNRAVKKIESRFRSVKPLKGNRRSTDDFFLVAKAEITQADKAAKVEFGVVQGREEASEEIYNYLVGTPSQTLRDWNVYARFPNKDTAERGVQAARQRYDQLIAYRQEMMKYFQAASMCRT